MRTTRYAVVSDKHPVWELVDPHYTSEMLGPFLPTFLHTDDPRPAAEQFNERYQYGGWQSFGKDKYTLDADNTLHYPGDPPFKPLAQCKLRDELICLYRGDFVAIIQPNRSFDVARLD